MSELNVFMSIPQTHLPPHMKEQWIFLLEIAWVHPSIIKKEAWKLFHNVERSFFLSIFHPNHPLLLNSFIRTSEESIWRTAAPTLTHSDISKKKKQFSTLTHRSDSEVHFSRCVKGARADDDDDGEKGKISMKNGRGGYFDGAAWKIVKRSSLDGCGGDQRAPNRTGSGRSTGSDCSWGAENSVCWVGAGKIVGVKNWCPCVIFHQWEAGFFFREGFWTFGIFWKGILVKLLMWNKFFKRLS